MKRANKFLFAAIALMLAPGLPALSSNYLSEVWQPDLGNGKYKNPVINADYSDPDVVRVGDDYYMTLYNADREPVMGLMHQNFQFLNGTWTVKEISGEPVNVPKMKLVIDVEEGKLHGNTGCNVLNGTLEINMESANSISFQSIGKTKMACPDDNYEMQLLVALEEAMRAKPLKGDKVELLDSQGKPVLLLARTSDK